MLTNHPQEASLHSQSFIVNSQEFNIFNLKKLLHQQLAPYAHLEAKDIRNLDLLSFNYFAVIVTRDLGIVLKDGVLPWQGYQNPLGFIRTLNEFINLIDKDDIESRYKIYNLYKKIPTDNPVIPHLIYLCNSHLNSTVKNEDMLTNLNLAKDCGNISSLFAIAYLFRIDNFFQRAIHEKSIKEIYFRIQYFLQKYGIVFTEQDQHLFTQAFAYQTFKAINLYHYFKKYEFLYKNIHPNHFNLISNLVLCENPIQALEVIINTRSFNKFLNGPHLDQQIILCLGKNINYCQESIDNVEKSSVTEHANIKEFFKQLRETVPENKYSVSDQCTAKQADRMNTRLANSLKNIMSNVATLEKNPHVINFILNKRKNNTTILLHSYNHILFLIFYPELINKQSKNNQKDTNINESYLSYQTVKKISEKKLKLLITGQQIFRTWERSILIDFINYNFTNDFYKHLKINLDHFKNLKSSSLKFLQEINGKNNWKLLNITFPLIKTFSINFTQQCFDYIDSNNYSLLEALAEFNQKAIINFISAHNANNSNIFALLIESYTDKHMQAKCKVQESNSRLPLQSLEPKMILEEMHINVNNFGRANNQDFSAESGLRDAKKTLSELNCTNSLIEKIAEEKYHINLFDENNLSLTKHPATLFSVSHKRNHANEDRNSPRKKFKPES